MPTPRENAAALVSRVQRVRAEAGAAQAARRQRAVAALAPLTAELDALAEALGAGGGEIGALRRRSAALGADGAFRVHYELTRADGGERHLLLRYATTPAGEETIHVGGLGRDLSDLLAAASVDLAGTPPVSDEAAFAAVDAPRAAPVVQAALERDLAAQGW